ncbi:pyridoxal phosphate-dependent aminotransferase [Roseivirga sp. 4D4]|uniref:pyridoxal phosphate-dependent aminotransferase n=1 Tax=Roseivirga sp. 4D4 TaxID=1889784 RepID=UPI00147A0658|nr:pyridoxal phosphate-dependent aminotransferase [Roseivirga sp. 4D4]
MREKNVQLYDFGQAIINMSPPRSVSSFLKSVDWSNPDYQRICPVPGMKSLRKKIAQYRQKVFDKPINEDNVIVTCGANHAVYMAINSISIPQDDVVVFSPYFFNHFIAIQTQELNPHPIRLGNDMLPDLDLITDDIVNKKAIVLSSPLNPSGTYLSADQLTGLSKMAQSKGTTLILDETYFEFQKENDPPNLLNDSTILVGSFSKSMCIAGLRIGYLIAPHNLIEEMLKLQDTMVISPNTIGQMAADKGLDEITSHTSKVRKELKKRSKALSEGLAEINVFDEIHGDIDLFHFTKLPGKKNGKTVKNDVLLAEELLKKGIIVMPGNVAGQQGYLRWTVGNISTEEISESIPILKAFFDSYSE